MESLTELRERRAFCCRLTPDRALRSLAEAEAFLRDRGLLTRTADCALPSLYEACHEDPYKPGSPGFAAWPATKWPWFGELAGRGYLVAAVHRERPGSRGRRARQTMAISSLATPRSRGCPACTDPHGTPHTGSAARSPRCASATPGHAGTPPPPPATGAPGRRQPEQNARRSRSSVSDSTLPSSSRQATSRPDHARCPPAFPRTSTLRPTLARASGREPGTAR